MGRKKKKTQQQPRQAWEGSGQSPPTGPTRPSMWGGHSAEGTAVTVALQDVAGGGWRAGAADEQGQAQVKVRV